jgi:hypothetical protein
MRSRRPRHILLISMAVLLSVVCLSVAAVSLARHRTSNHPRASPPPSAHPTTSPRPTASTKPSLSPEAARIAQVTSAIETNLSALMKRTDASDPRYYSKGVWYDGSSNCFRCTVGPGVEAAAYGVATGSESYLSTAILTFDTAIAGHQRENGSFGPGGTGEGKGDIQTSLFGSELAEVYLMLGKRLDSHRRSVWAKSLARAADFLIANGNLRWYTNGNIVLANALMMDLTYRITRLARFKTAAATAIHFAISPPQNRWYGFGLQYTKNPKKADGSDGAGYFAESDGSTPGYDPAYTMMQVNVTSFWYLLTRNATAKRLTNLLTNELMKRTSTSDWTIDISGGTRHHVPAGQRYGFYVSSISVLALRGGRKDLVKYVQPQTKVLLNAYLGATGFTGDGWSYSFGSELAPILFVQLTTRGW